ncbi:lytic transglycosylase domain-containing protein [Candidatus Nitrospira bockiana]
MRTPARRRWTHVRLVVFGAFLAVAAGLAWSAWTPDIAFPRVPMSANLGEPALNTWSGCLREAAGDARVDPALLEAIVQVESGEHPFAFGWFDQHGTRHFFKAPSYSRAVAQFEALEQRHLHFDVGLAQVNSRNLKTLERRLGIPPDRALDPCTNLRLAGIILGEQIRVHGRTWRAVAGYNGALSYVPKVHRAYCRDLPGSAPCRRRLGLSELLCEPLPLAETQRYYRVFSRRL